jgi:chromosome segregation ATPase
MNNLTVGMILNYSPFSSAFGALPWLVGVELAIAAFALVVTVRRGPELAVPVPVEKLREFVGLYDERLALSRELIVMEEEVARGGMVKHEFRRRAKVMELRLDEINKSLMDVKGEIRAVSPRYDELVRRIDRAEAEIQVSRTSLNQVRGQYRSGRTTRETYDAMVNDITKRIDRSEATVETILITLREDAR